MEEGFGGRGVWRKSALVEEEGQGGEPGEERGEGGGGVPKALTRHAGPPHSWLVFL